MKKKVMTRVLTLGMLGVVAWFSFLLNQTKTYSIDPEKSVGPAVVPEATASGRDVTYQTFDIEGQETAMVRSGQVAQLAEEAYRLDDRVLMRVKVESTLVTVRAEGVEHKPSGDRILTSAPGRPIELETESGLRIQTVGPLIATAKNLFYTDAPAFFQLGVAEGECVGLAYKPEDHIELRHKASFLSRDGDHTVFIDADYMSLDLVENRGLVRQGSITSVQMGKDELESVRQQVVTLIAEDMHLVFAGEGGGRRFLLRQADILGNPGMIRWDDGILESQSFDVCFNPGGQGIDSVVTGETTDFDLLTEDGYRLDARCGPMQLSFVAAYPHELRSFTPVSIHGIKPASPQLVLQGQKGLLTTFRAGRASSTRLFGSPSFAFGAQQGRSGSLRLLHGERKILFGEDAEVRDLDQGITVSGDEVLFADWDRDDREIFANGFVELAFRDDTDRSIKGSGHQLTVKLPAQRVDLQGAPALLRQGETEVKAEQILLQENEVGQYVLQARGRVSMIYPVEKGRFHIEGQELEYDEGAGRLFVNKVSRASVPQQGTFSCERLEVGMAQGAPGNRVQTLAALGAVVFQGSVLQEGKPEPFSCEADRLHFDAEKQILRFEGDNRDIIIRSQRGEQRGRQLTYHLGDGSMRVDSGEHSTTRTTIPLKDIRR